MHRARAALSAVGLGILMGLVFGVLVLIGGYCLLLFLAGL